MLLLLPLLLFAAADALLTTQADFLMGSDRLSVLYDPTKPFPSRVMHVYTSNSTRYAVALNGGISANVICRKVVTRQIIVSPRGCDALTPTDAVVDYYCEYDALALQKDVELTDTQWSLSADSPQCIDPAACFGPPYVPSERWTPDELITDLDLLTSRRDVFLVSAGGPAGDIKMTTYVPIEMPKIAMYGSCENFEDMQFEVSAKDNYEGAYVNATYTYGVGISRRLRFEREGFGFFRLVLGYKGGTADFYNDVYKSVDLYAGIEDVIDKRVVFQVYVAPTPGPTAAPTPSPSYAPSIAPSQAPTTTSTPTTTWAPTQAPTSAPTLNPTSAPTSTPTLNPTTVSPTRAPGSTFSPTSTPSLTPTLTPTNAPTTQCTLEVSVVAAPRPFKLVYPTVPDDLTYYHDKRGTYVTAECSLRRCLLDENGDLVCSDGAPNTLLGGRSRFRAPGPFGQKFRVEPNLKYKDFEWICTKFWPRAAEFVGLRGASVTRDMPDLLACNAPFPFPELIEAKDYDVAEKLRQCKMLGGRGMLSTIDYCTFDVTTTLCRKGWYFFDEMCYYRPDTLKDGRFRARQEDADSVCSQLHPKAKAATNVDQYTERWIQSNFIYQNPVGCGTDPVRVLIAGTRCKCYDCLAQEINGTAVADGTVIECSCETPTYPLCAYKMKDDYIAWNDEKFHPSTLQVMRDGQCLGSNEAGCKGNERYGKELDCECFPGSVGEYCERRSCVYSVAALTGNGTILRFAQTCEKHGFCVEGQENACQCMPGFGPPSVIGRDPFNDVACLIPTTNQVRDSAAGFIVDGVLYTGYDYGVCNGASAGVAVCDPVTRICRCVCQVRKNMDPDGEPFEPAYDGESCVAPTPMLPADGFQNNDGIVERMCNGRGTVCPTGERLSEKRTDGTYVVTRDSDLCRGQLDGCVCDNGFWGKACTSPVPPDESARKPTFVDYGAYVPIKGGRNPVMNVHVHPEAAYAGVVPTCDVVQVYLSDSTLNNAQRACNKTGEDGRYWCGGQYGTYVVVLTAEERPSCSIEVFTENFAPCGNYTDARISRFFANEVYRDFNRTDEFQSLLHAQYGSSVTECMCDKDHTGRLCGNRISSKRYDSDGVASARVCGEETLPQRGRPRDDGTGCECNVIAGNQMTGSACQCAIIPDLGLCGGIGTCVEPEMTPSMCEFDTLDELADSLSSPFSEVTPPDAVRRSTYVVTNRSVFEFEGESWLVWEGQTLQIESLKGNVSICHDNSMYPLNITHECGQPTYVLDPVRAIANVTVVEFFFDCFEGVCTTTEGARYDETCDPAFSCPTSRFCPQNGTLGTESPCLLINEWMQDMSEEGRLLPSKTYINSRATCVEASKTTTDADVEFPYGVFPTCADPVYRWLDGSLVGAGYVAKRQCEGIGHHDNTKGEIFGVFDNMVPGLDFRKQEWDAAHYAFVASIMNDKVCVQTVNGYQKYVADALSDPVIDAYGISLVSLGAEDEVVLGNSSTPIIPTFFSEVSLTRDDDLSTWWGNPYWHPNKTGLVFGPETRWGGWLRLPTQGEVRRVTVRNGGTQTIYAFALVGPRGYVCGTYLKRFEPDDVVTIDCGSTFETETLVHSLRRLWDLNLTAQSSAMLNFASVYSPYVMLYSADSAVELHEGDFAYTSRSVSYIERWRSISGQIIGQKTFPYNAPFEAECTKLGGTTVAVNLTNPNDLAFLHKVHHVHLSRRVCTHDWQCKRFARNNQRYRCVPDDSVPAELWRNGDPLKQSAVVGVEGGCEFRHLRELMDPQFSGSRCLPGHEATWRSVIDFERDASAALLNSTQIGWTEPFVLYNASEWTDSGTPKCVLPSGVASGRTTEACGGARGQIKREFYETQSNVTIFAGNKYKRCVALVLDGEVLEAHADEQELDLHSFGNYRVNVIHGGRVFIDGTECVFAESPTECGIECVQRDDSDTHRVRSFIDAAPIVAKPRDFWTYFISSM